MKYKVRFYQNGDYEVWFEGWGYDESGDEEYRQESVFQGSLADCEAYIRLHENGYM